MDGLLSLSTGLNEAVSAIDELERIVKQTADLGWDAKAKVFSELASPQNGRGAGSGR